MNDGHRPAEVAPHGGGLPVPEGAVDLVDVFVVEDDLMVRDWLWSALEGSEFRLVGEASTGEAALELAPPCAPHVLLVDYRLADCLGTELIRDFRQAGVDTPALLMTANARDGFNRAARDAGAQGSILKSGIRGELLAGLRAVAAGRMWFDARHSRRTAESATADPSER